MRISVVQGPFLPVPPLLGGAVEKIWFDLAQALAASGHCVTQLSRTFEGLPEREERHGVQHLRVAGAATPGSWRAFGRVDLLWPMRLVRDWAYCRRILRVLPPADLLVSNTFFLPMLLPTHGPQGALYIHCQRFPQAQYRWYQHAARLQAVSAAVADRIVEVIPAAAPRVRIIPNPIPQSFGLPSADALNVHLQTDRRLVLFVGRIHPQKGVRLLLEAFRRFRSSEVGAGWRLRLVGPVDAARGGGGEDYAAEMRRLAAPLGEAVEWAGFVADPATLETHYREASIFVYPSVDAAGEASPVAPVEAMACGCAVVVSNLRCFADYLQAGVSGEVFAHEGTEAASELAQSLLRLASDSHRRQAVAAAGWAAANELRLPRIAAQYETDFASVAHPAR